MVETYKVFRLGREELVSIIETHFGISFVEVHLSSKGLKAVIKGD